MSGKWHMLEGEEWAQVKRESRELERSWGVTVTKAAQRVVVDEETGKAVWETVIKLSPQTPRGSER